MTTEPGRKAARMAVARELARQGSDATALAKRAGIHPQTVQAMVSGARWPSLRTLGALDAALGWQAGTLSSIAEGAPEPGAADAAPEIVSGPGDAGGSLLVLRPNGLTDDEWASIVEESRGHLEWLVERAARKRREQQG